MSRRVIHVSVITLALAFVLAGSAGAQSPQQFAPDATRYMALGDSIAAGYKAMPVTEGYAYRLYFGGAFDRVAHTLFCNIGTPGATSLDVLTHQVPLATKPGGFNPKYITLTVGGNDLLALLYYVQTHPDATPEQIEGMAAQTIASFAGNLAGILTTLRMQLPEAKIFVANQYPLTELAATGILPDTLIPLFNGYLEQVVDTVGTQLGNVYLVDVYSAFLGRTNLVEGERGNTSLLEVHPTNAGHRVIEKAFADAIAQAK